MAARTVCSCSERGPEETPVGVESSKLSACLRLQTTVSANCNYVKKRDPVFSKLLGVPRVLRYGRIDRRKG